MSRSTRVTAVLLTVVVFAGILVTLRALPPLPGAPQISPRNGEIQVTSPGVIQGVAGTTPPGPVTVRAFIDGVELEGSPDVIMNGSLNEYSFAIPPEKSGHTLVIKAIAANGTTSTESHVLQ